MKRKVKQVSLFFLSKYSLHSLMTVCIFSVLQGWYTAETHVKHGLQWGPLQEGDFKVWRNLWRNCPKYWRSRADSVPNPCNCFSYLLFFCLSKEVNWLRVSSQAQNDEFAAVFNLEDYRCKNNANIQWTDIITQNSLSQLPGRKPTNKSPLQWQNSGRSRTT